MLVSAEAHECRNTGKPLSLSKTQWFLRDQTPITAFRLHAWPAWSEESSEERGQLIRNVGFYQITAGYLLLPLLPTSAGCVKTCAPELLARSVAAGIGGWMTQIAPQPQPESQSFLLLHLPSAWRAGPPGRQCINWDFFDNALFRSINVFSSSPELYLN